MQRYALGIEYEGTHYFGWQRQQSRVSVQEKLETALSTVANHPISVMCAGRTDAGVHATGQVIHFDSNAERAHIAWVRGVNMHLPPDIRVHWCQPVTADFDARRSALFRRYCYIILNQNIPPGILRNAVMWAYSPLDADLMHEGAQYLIGDHDFSSFRAAGCQSISPRRMLSSLTVSRQGDFICVDVTANAFLYHMVRNIVGSLITLSIKGFPPEWIGQILAEHDRTKAAITAPASGLYLVDVGYSSKMAIPQFSNKPWFASHIDLTNIKMDLP